MQKLSEPTSAVAGRHEAPTDTRPDWLVRSVAEGHAFLDALDGRIAAREAETRIRLDAAWAEFDRTFVRRSELHARSEPDAPLDAEGQPR